MKREREGKNQNENKNDLSPFHGMKWTLLQIRQIKKKQVQKIKRREELDKKKSKEKKRNNSFRNMYIEG